MTTPTPSMRLFGQIGREAQRKRIRHEAAKKAWRTRRRLAKPTPTMRTIMEGLIASDARRIYLHYCGTTHYGTGITNWTYGPRLSYSTFRAMEKRDWVKLDRRVECGETISYESGQELREPNFDLLYRLSDKGIKALK